MKTNPRFKTVMNQHALKLKAKLDRIREIGKIRYATRHPNKAQSQQTDKDSK